MGYVCLLLISESCDGNIADQHRDVYVDCHELLTVYHLDTCWQFPHFIFLFHLILPFPRDTAWIALDKALQYFHHESSFFDQNLRRLLDWTIFDSYGQY